MDPLSAASAIGGLVILGGEIASKAHDFFDKLKGCPRRVRNIQYDLRSTTSILKQLKVALKNPSNAGVFSLKDKKKEFRSVIKGLEEVFYDLEDLMDEYGSLGSGRLSLKKLKWAATGEEAAINLGRLLSMQKMTLGVTLQLAQSDTISSIDRGVTDQKDELRIIQSQVYRLLNGRTGVNDPRLGGWLESVAEYAESVVDDAATVPADISFVRSVSDDDGKGSAAERSETKKRSIQTDVESDEWMKVDKKAAKSGKKVQDELPVGSDTETLTELDAQMDTKDEGQGEHKAREVNGNEPRLAYSSDVAELGNAEAEEDAARVDVRESHSEPEKGDILPIESPRPSTKKSIEDPRDISPEPIPIPKGSRETERPPDALARHLAHPPRMTKLEKKAILRGKSLPLMTGAAVDEDMEARRKAKRLMRHLRRAELELLEEECVKLELQQKDLEQRIRIGRQRLSSKAKGRRKHIAL